MRLTTEIVSNNNRLILDGLTHDETGNINFQYVYIPMSKEEKTICTKYNKCLLENTNKGVNYGQSNRVLSHSNYHNIIGKVVQKIN